MDYDVILYCNVDRELSAKVSDDNLIINRDKREIIIYPDDSLLLINNKTNSSLSFKQNESTSQERIEKINDWVKKVKAKFTQ